MKKSIFFSLSGILLATLVFIILSSCEEDNSYSESAMSANIKNALTLRFSTAFVTLSNTQNGDTIERSAVGTVIKGSTTYSITLKIYDVGQGKGTYNLEKKEGYAELVMTSQKTTFYYLNETGEITLTECDDKNWVGSFHFNATSDDSTKLIEVYDGKVNIHK